MTIQRYDTRDRVRISRALIESDSGRFITHSDHLVALDEAQAELLSKTEELGRAQARIAELERQLAAKDDIKHLTV